MTDHVLISRATLQQVLAAMEYHTAQTRPIVNTNEAIRDVKALLAEPCDPVGWRNNINYCVQFRSDEMTPEVVAGYMTPQWTWLYAAPKEPT